MRVALAADHAGVTLKELVKPVLDEMGVAYEDFGTHSTESVDYPDFAARVAHDVAGGRADRGILVCGTAIGMALAANKVRGIRAAPVGDLTAARLSRSHNDANVLALGARVTPTDLALAIVRTFLTTAFEGGRHQRRIRKITVLEEEAALERPTSSSSAVSQTS
jgi:ribose 5-phosphate isomerase B